MSWGFSYCLCALRCLGRTIEDSGLDASWVEAELYGSVTVQHILNGKHHNRAIEAHQITLQVLYDKFTHMYMHQVIMLQLKFLDATRNPDNQWHLCLATLEKMCVYFFLTFISTTRNDELGDKTQKYSPPRIRENYFCNNAQMLHNLPVALNPIVHVVQENQMKI